MKGSALEVTGLLKSAAAKGLAKGETPTPEKTRTPPERERPMVKPFEIGI
jgi:hypothetical protein